MDVDIDRTLIGEVRKQCDEVTTTFKKFKSLFDKLETLTMADEKNGVSLFNVKVDSMFSYLNNILYLMLRKFCGLSLDDEATRGRLGEIRIILERIKPIELKLKYQIDKFMKMSASKSDILDKTAFRAKLENLNDVTFGEDHLNMENNDDGDDEVFTENSTLENEKTKVGVYKPPKIIAVPYDDGNEEEKRLKKLEQSKKRALSTSIMQELREEYADTPLEVSNAITLRNKRTNYRQEKESYEETYFTRLPTTKRERHQDKMMSSLTVGTLGTEVTRFEDISALEEDVSRIQKKRKTKLSVKKRGKSFKKRKFH